MAKLTKAQEQVVNHDSGNILVSASAGSGKTHTMIERVIKLIVDGKARVDQILAATFTEKAASDMKEKLKKALIKKYEQTNDARLIKELNRIATADICTIDSFCARLVRLYFFKVGLSPDFKIADTATSAPIMAESLDKTMREFYAVGDKGFLDFVDMYAHKRSDKRLREMIIDAFHFCSNEPNLDEFIQKYKSVFTADGVDSFAVDYKKSINKKLAIIIPGLRECKGYFDSVDHEKGRAFCQGVISDIGDMIALPDAYALENHFNYNRKQDIGKGLDEVGESYKNLAVKLRDSAKKILKDVQKNLVPREIELERVEEYYSNIEWFSKILVKFSENYSAEKREENLLDFGDLEHFALEILQDEQVCAEVRARYKYVFIDEYQDVNTIQEEILKKVSKDNLFMVGDLKQGIYAFRGCRSEIFAGKLKNMPAQGQTVVRLNENFRSAPAVVDAVNEIFDFCMTDEYFEENYKGNSDLVFGGLFPNEFKGRAQLHHLISREKDEVLEQPRVYDVLEEIKKPYQGEDEDVVALIEKIINDELGSTIYDVKAETERPVKYGDIAILARTKTSEYAKNLVKGLVARGIPVVSDSNENVCDYPEIAMLVNALKLVDCFLQDIPLASTLKSHIGGFTDEDLYDIVSFYREKTAGGSFTDAYYHYINNAQTPLKDRLLQFDEYFKKVRFISDFSGAYGGLKMLVADKDLESYLLSESEGKTKHLRLKRFVMAAVHEGRKLTVKEFLNKIEASADAFSLAEGGDENAVSVLTMHASKGLEFPVVITCGLEKKFDDRDNKKEILFSRKYGFVPRYYDKEKRTKEKTLFRAAIISEQNEERLKEEMRLFYVTATRATYSLHAIFCDEQDGRTVEFTTATKFYNFIPKSMPVTTHTASELAFEKLYRGRRKVLIGDFDEKKCQIYRERFAFVYPYLNDVTLPLKSDVTSATKNFGEDFYDSVVLFPEEKTDIERGNIAHKIMENLDFSFKSPFDYQVSAMVDSGILREEDIEKVNLKRIESAIVDADLKGLCASGERYSEKGFLTEVYADMIFPNLISKEKIVLQGVVDLLILDKDTAKIVDYKYSKLSKDGLAKKYYKQLELYAYAVEKALGKKVAVKKIVNLFTGESVDIV